MHVKKRETEQKGLGESKERREKACVETVEKEACTEKEEREKKVFGEGNGGGRGSGREDGRSGKG